MDGTDFKFDLGQRVRLRDGVDPGFYAGMAKVGNEGWIHGHRRDRFGLPEVYVVWDSNHWAFNQQPDKWTFQEHFDPVEETSVSDQPDPRAEAAEQAALEFARKMASLFTKQEVVKAPEAPQEAHTHSLNAMDLPGSLDPADRAAQYAEHVSKAATAMAESEAFICITITRKDDERAPQGALYRDVIGDAQSPESEVLLGSEVAQNAAMFHRSAGMLLVGQFAEERDKRERDGRQG